MAGLHQTDQGQVKPLLLLMPMTIRPSKRAFLASIRNLASRHAQAPTVALAGSIAEVSVRRFKLTKAGTLKPVSMSNGHTQSPRRPEYSW